MATLAEEIRALLQSIGPDLIPQAQGLPAVAPQSVQSGNPTPQNVGQTLGPQPGDPRNATRQQLGQEFTQAAGSFAASAADPLGIPSAVTGMFSPQMRDAWRQYQGAAGPVVQMAGGAATGIPSWAMLMRGGNALGGIPGRIAGGGVSGSGPTIDYAARRMAGDETADPVNAIVGPLSGAAFPAGQALAPIMNNAGTAARLAIPGAALAGTGAVGYGMLQAADEAEAQNPGRGIPTPARPTGRPAQPAGGSTSVAAPADGGFDARTMRIIEQNADLRAIYAQLQEQLTAASRSPHPSISSADRARAIKESEALRKQLNDGIKAIAAGQAPFSQAHPWMSSILQGLQVAAPTALGLATRRANVGAHNARIAPWQGAVDDAFAASPIPPPAAPPQGIVPRIQAAIMGPQARPAINPNANPAAFEAATHRAIGNRDEWNRVQNLPMWQTGAVHAGENAMVAGAGGLMAMEASMYPHLYNMQRTEPGSEAHSSALTNFANARGQNGQNALLGQWMPAATGTAAALSGMHIPIGRRAPAPVGDTNALEKMLKQPAAPPPPVGPVPPGPPARYVGGVQRNFQSTVARAVEDSPRTPFDPQALLNSISVFPSRRPQLEAALQQVQSDLSGARTDAARRVIANRITSGGYQGLVITGAIAGGVAAHHSQSQTRGGDGRFVGEEP